MPQQIPLNLLNPQNNPAVPENLSEETLFLLALLQVSGIGTQTLHKLFQHFGSFQAIWQASANHLQQHLPSATQENLLQHRKKVHLGTLLAPYEAQGIQLVSLYHPDYPALLKQIHGAPPLLFVKGNAKALVGKTLSFVGSRNMSYYGRQVTEKLIQELAPVKPCIVSGLAAGVDGQSHQSALERGLLTVAVFGCGLDTIFPAQHKPLAKAIAEAGGAWVSEYPLGVLPDRSTFPKRNRIISGLSYGVVVIEGGVKSGSLITARLALEENRQVYAVPGNVLSPGAQGPLSLIKSGAIPVSEGRDILDDLRWYVDADKSASSTILSDSTIPLLAPTQQQVLRQVGYDPTPMERIQQETGLDPSSLNAILTFLELEGFIVTLPGAKVSRT